MRKFKETSLWKFILVSRIVFSNIIPVTKDLLRKDKFITDTVARIFKFYPSDIFYPESEQDLVDIVLKAKLNNKNIAIAGQKFSQGGQWAKNYHYLIDLSNFNKVLFLDKIKKEVTVQTGITWGTLQKYINPAGLAIKVMQSSNLFSVGGGLSINCHGRDVRYGAIVNTVKSIKVLLSSGEVRIASRDINSDLFFGIIGGMGRLGIILEATLSLRDNVICSTEHSQQLPIEKFIPTYIDVIKKDPELAFGRVTVGDKNYLNKFFITSYVSTKSVSTEPLKDSKNSYLVNYLMALQRDLPFGKNLRDFLEYRSNKKEIISLNNAMNPMVNFLLYKNREENLLFKRIIFLFKKSYRFLRQRPLNQTDVLREYFIPLRNFDKFLNLLKNSCIKKDINLINITFRYVPKKDSCTLDYTKENCIALVLNVNIGLDQKSIRAAQEWTQVLADNALNCEGSFYLAYQPWETYSQVKSFYNVDEFNLLKRKFDPTNMFDSEFYLL